MANRFALLQSSDEEAEPNLAKHEVGKRRKGPIKKTGNEANALGKELKRKRDEGGEGHHDSKAAGKRQRVDDSTGQEVEMVEVAELRKCESALSASQEEVASLRRQLSAAKADPNSKREALQEKAQQAATEPGLQEGIGPAAGTVGHIRNLASGVKVQVMREGPAGANLASQGKVVKCIYEGRLPEKKDPKSIHGKRFDAGNVDFIVGDGSMVLGFDSGVRGMAVGERRLIHVPWRMGYGKKGKSPKIPPRSDLIFDVALTFADGTDWTDQTLKGQMSNKRREKAKQQKRKGKKT